MLSTCTSNAFLPQRPGNSAHEFDFVDLFAGIGGIRRGFEDIGGRCVFTSEWNTYAVRTYKANYYCDPDNHTFNEDIRSVTLSGQPDISENDAYRHIDNIIPDHDVLLAGFPCQPFSIAGVSKKKIHLAGNMVLNAKPRAHFFYDVARIIAAKQPPMFLLENVKKI
ncbi:DNA (cytosine-5-)-methyltransferase [Undibacterium arcticum]